MYRTKHVLLTAIALTTTLTAGCAANVGTKADAQRKSPAAGTAAGSTAATTEKLSADTIRLGYFANITHAIPVVGVQNGTFQERLGSTKVETQTFNAGPAAVEALFGGALDATYIGPNPAINAFAKSKGEAIRIIAGATTGGASLVVQSDAGIETVADLKGKKIATPQKGGTQDIALRAFLKENGITVGGGPDAVDVLNTENATTLEQFKAKTIAGGWLPEPWASRLVLEGSAKVLLDEKTRWPDGKFVTTHLIVSTKFLTEHPDVVKKLLEAHVATADAINKDKKAAKATINTALKSLTGKALKDDVLNRAFDQIVVTTDPAADSLAKTKDNAVAAGLLKEVDLRGIYDLTLLNEVLTAAGSPAVADAGLGKG